MGYQDRVVKANCGNCGNTVGWSYKPPKRDPSSWACKCGYTNYLRPVPAWPNVPRDHYIGHDFNARMKLYATPPDDDGEWAQPYSVRSFVYQASQKYRNCTYRCYPRGVVMGESVFNDMCDGDECHLVNGWTIGEKTCPLWESIKSLCQTESERNFLHRYLGYVKDRQFPMLIPQVWLGIADRRRTDFVAYVPLQHWKYRWIAVELDGAHPPESQGDFERNQYIQDCGYEVISLRPDEKGYLEEVRKLVELIEKRMRVVEENYWQVAIEVKVASTSETFQDIPF